MRRFPPRDLPPRDRRPHRELPRPEGPFDRLLRSRPERDPAPLIIGGTVAFLALVIVLLFVFSRLLGGNQGIEGETVVEMPGITGRLARIPGLPPGLVAVSEFVEFETEGDIFASIALPLKGSPGDPQRLGFYTFLNQRWQRVADVRLVDGGTRAEADFSPVPPNLVVLRVVAQTYQVAGSLPAGKALHPSARVDIVSPRDYAPAEDGTLQGTATPLEVDQGVLVIPTIVGSTQATAPIVNDILADPTLRQRHQEEILRLVKEGGFDGVDLEYSAVEPALGPAFTSFVQGLAEALHAEGLRLSLTLPPPSGQPGPYNWKALGEAADIIKVLPIADPVAYWEEMPKAIEALLRDVQASKVMLVVSPFSEERSGSTTRVVGYLETMLLASEIALRQPQNPEEILPGVSVELVAPNLDEGEGASGLHWSDEAAAVSFSAGGRTFFIENVFSAGFKLELVQAYGLGGVAVADASADTDVADIWPAVNQLVEAGTVTLVRPNEDVFLPRWVAPDGGDLSSSVGTAITWNAPLQPGSYRLEMIISDGQERFGRRLTVEVREALEPTPTPTATPAQEPTPTATATPGSEPTPTPGPGLTPTPELTPTGTPTPGQELDSDGDGVSDSLDLCPQTAAGAQVDASGCSDAQVDGDGDGICDPNAPSSGPSQCTGSDNCPAQPNPGQEDADGDGIGNACDSEGPPGNSNGISGVDDCIDVVDNDGDGLIDSEDPDCA